MTSQSTTQPNSQRTANELLEEWLEPNENEDKFDDTGNSGTTSSDLFSEYRNHGLTEEQSNIIQDLSELRSKVELLRQTERYGAMDILEAIFPEPVRNIVAELNGDIAALLEDAKKELELTVDDVRPHVSARWENRANKSQSIVDFLKDNYSRWLGRGLTISIIKEIDPPARNAFYNTLSKDEQQAAKKSLPLQKKWTQDKLTDLPETHFDRLAIRRLWTQQNHRRRGVSR